MNLKQIRLYEKAIIRKRRRRKRIEKVHNAQKRKKHTPYVKSMTANRYTSYGRPYAVVAPADFSIDNIEHVISFLSEVDQKCRQQKVKLLKVDLAHVKKIDEYSISLLLSLLNRLSCKKIHYWGTYPEDFACKQFIIGSGFLDIMQTNIQRPSSQNNGNQMFMVGKNCVDSKRIGRAVKESMVHIVGEECVYPPLYDNLLEISANSVEHANTIAVEKNWLISITKNNDKLHFILTDTGFGILATIKKKIIQELNDTFLRNKAEILRNVFLKLYQSVTGEMNRHKGLPIIYESFTEGYISDLQVLTNEVFYNFTDNSYRIFKKGFKGVLYSWSITIDNYNNWIKSLQ